MRDLSVCKQNWLDIKEGRHAAIHYPPEVKRQQPMPPIEDLESPPPPLVDEYDSEL